MSPIEEQVQLELLKRQQHEFLSQQKEIDLQQQKVIAAVEAAYAESSVVVEGRFLYYD